MRGRTETIAISVLLFLLSACSSSDVKQQEIDQNIALLKEIEEADMSSVSNTVAGVQEALARKRKKAGGGTLNYREIFRNTVVMGDSIAAGLVEYNLLNPIQVVADRGKNLATIGDDIQTVIQLAPTDIFFSYGMNDLGYCSGDANLFIERYEDVIGQIREALPHVRLHVNAILPIQQHAIDANPVYANYPEFNAAMKSMCERMDIDFIDNSSIIKTYDIPYNYDGVHPVFDFFPYWLDHMAERLK